MSVNQRNYGNQLGLQGDQYRSVVDFSKSRRNENLISDIERKATTVSEGVACVSLPRLRPIVELRPSTCQSPASCVQCQHLSLG